MLATHHLALHEDKVGRRDLRLSSGPEGTEPGAPLDLGTWSVGLGRALGLLQ